MIYRFGRILFVALIVGLILGGTPFAAAEQETSPSPATSTQPLIVKWAASGDTSYFQSDKKITGEKDLKAIIVSANDPLATKLINKSEDQETIGTIGLFTGTFLIGAGFTMSTLDIIGNNGWDGKVDAETAITLLSGASIDVLSLLVLDESTTTKFASVERYNQVVRNEPGLSLSLQGNRSGGLSLALKF